VGEHKGEPKKDKPLKPAPIKPEQGDKNPSGGKRGGDKK
jgi:hypothetical protein